MRPKLKLGDKYVRLNEGSEEFYEEVIQVVHILSDNVFKYKVIKDSPNCRTKYIGRTYETTSVWLHGKYKLFSTKTKVGGKLL